MPPHGYRRIRISLTGQGRGYDHRTRGGALPIPKTRALVGVTVVVVDMVYGLHVALGAGGIASSRTNTMLHWCPLNANSFSAVPCGPNGYP
jgi:hypothetical protein